MTTSVSTCASGEAPLTDILDGLSIISGEGALKTGFASCPFGVILWTCCARDGDLAARRGLEAACCGENRIGFGGLGNLTGLAGVDVSTVFAFGRFLKGEVIGRRAGDCNKEAFIGDCEDSRDDCVPLL